MKFPGKSAWLGLSLAVILLDQLSKWFVAAHMHVYETIYVLPVFNVALLHNTGAAFSMLAGQPGWQRWFFVVLALVIAGLIVAWLWRMPAGAGHWLAAGLALVAGGAVGNVWDRLVQGYVVDFMQFHWQGWFFPAFNVADSAITVGAIMLILDGLFQQRRIRAVK
ncbi:MAG TPA: signal peptidase II [Gammaproteobacteria bacterium]|nr:signal peptidase II [Gammaproteobacteria bacterium]